VVVTNASCSAVGDADPQSLGVTYWFDTEPDGEPYTMTVHLKGWLKDGSRSAEPPTADGPRREFTTVSTLEDVVPGSGRVAFTTRIPNLAAGEWEVEATPVRRATPGSTSSWVEVRSYNLPRGRATGPTAFAPLARNLGPGVHLGAWPALVGTGFVLGLLVQAALASRMGLAWLPLLLLTLGASAAGLLGAKTYFLLTHPGEARSLTTPGLSVQGFVITTLTILFAGASLLDLSPGAALDTTGPALLVGMAVGRWGCLFGGCCTGRPTTSKWGVWSSDRRVGVKRIPVQVMESGLAAVLAAAALAAALWAPGAGSGLVLVSSVAAYVLGRQLLFPLRSVARATTHGRLVTLVTASVVLPVATALLILG
jgi:phosphatidylglycerol:prolipoprotein diacylglycerol transferase